MSSDEALKMELPPHGPANMLDLFMTRYDYDYNRDPQKEYEHEKVANLEDNTDGWLSGEVRNRPPIGVGGEWSGDTTYHRDYTPKSRCVGDMNEVHRRIGTEPASTAFLHDWYRPDLTSGEGANSEYKSEYTHSGRIPNGETILYAGAMAAPYKGDFLHAKGVKEDDGSDIPPKITSKESLLPRHITEDGEKWKEPVTLLPSRQPQLSLQQKMDPNDYWCTSWTYGDKSLAYPNQLPQALAGSRRENLIGQVSDKAELLRLLAGKGTTKAVRRHGAKDDTNPIYISLNVQNNYSVPQNIEDNGFIKRTIYRHDYVNPYRLPELPGSQAQPDDRNTNTSHFAAAGEMSAGQLSSYMHKIGNLRNSHGYIKELPEDPNVKLPMPRTVLMTLRELEKVDEVDKADPHRHKMHGEKKDIKVECTKK